MIARKVAYRAFDALMIQIVLYFNSRRITCHDVDNRVKDILDALQARMGGPKAVRSHAPLIPNDSQVFEVIVKKLLPPKQSKGLGHVTISKCRQSAMA